MSVSAPFDIKNKIKNPKLPKKIPSQILEYFGIFKPLLKYQVQSCASQAIFVSALFDIQKCQKKAKTTKKIVGQIFGYFGVFKKLLKY